jgi:ABC-2 type transport system permease protein
MRLLAHQTRFELLAFLRNRQAPFFTAALPVIFLVIFVSVFGGNRVGPEHIEASSFYVPGIAALAIISAAFANLAIGVTAQRELGILKRRRAAPVPRWTLVVARAVGALLVAVAVVALVLAVGAVAFDVRPAAAGLPAIAAAAIVGSIAFACLGYALSTFIGSAEAAQPVVLAVTLPLYFISGVFIPSLRLPTGLQRIAEAFPVEHLVEALHAGFPAGGGAASVAWTDLAVVAAWGLAGFAIAVRRFSWAPAGQPA